MKFLRRHKFVLFALGVYWPLIFWLTHTLVVLDIAWQSGMSDKMMHVLAYFVLTFLAWFAVSPNEKVRWNKWKCWVLLMIIIVYAVIDEYLQSKVGRSADVLDFAADLFGSALGFGLLSLLSFWLAMLTTSAVLIFVISDMSHLLMLYSQYHLDTVFHFTAYAAFALIWIQHLELSSGLNVGRSARLIYALLIPLGLLLMVKGTAPLFDRSIEWIETAAALFGIASAIAISYLTIHLFRKT